MKHLLAAIDYSKTSMSTFLYATHLAERLGAKLTVLHIVAIPLHSETGLLSADYSIPYQVAKEKMQYFVYELAKLQHIEIPKIDIETVVETGSPALEIAAYAKEHEVDMILMGTISKSSVFQRVLGSVTSASINAAPCPVLLIHDNTNFVIPKKVVIGIDNEGQISSALDQYIQLNTILESYTEFVHIQIEQNESIHSVKKEIIHELLDENKVPFAFEIKQVSGQNPSQDIVDYSIFSKADMLVLIHHDKNIFHRVFSGSVSFKTAQKIHLPVLIIPNH